MADERAGLLNRLIAGLLGDQTDGFVLVMTPRPGEDRIGIVLGNVEHRQAFGLLQAARVRLSDQLGEIPAAAGEVPESLALPSELASQAFGERTATMIAAMRDAAVAAGVPGTMMVLLEIGDGGIGFRVATCGSSDLHRDVMGRLAQKTNDLLIESLEEVGTRAGTGLH